MTAYFLVSICAFIFIRTFDPATTTARTIIYSVIVALFWPALILVLTLPPDRVNAMLDMLKKRKRP